MTARYNTTEGGCLNFSVTGMLQADGLVVTLTNPPQAWIDVFQERNRQVKDEGFDTEHDDQHTSGELLFAARSYADQAQVQRDWPPHTCPDTWPWGSPSWKPRSQRENLVRATALLLAAIEHLDRAQARFKQPK